jgi:hypothetical protein
LLFQQTCPTMSVHQVNQMAQAQGWKTQDCLQTRKCFRQADSMVYVYSSCFVL